MRRTAGLFIMSIAGCPVGETAPPDTALDTSTSGTHETSSGASSSSTATDPITDATASDATRADTSSGDTEDPPSAFECDLFAQACPRGQKCAAWSNDGGPGWNATRCVPIVDDPGGVGDPCTVQAHPWSGLDDCDIGLVCWGVNADNVGHCVALCRGSPENPTCENRKETCALCDSNCLPICVATCDPLLQDCADEREVCYPVGDEWSCAVDASGKSGTYGDPCEAINACDAGYVCIGTVAFTDCQGAIGCCSLVCDITDPASDPTCAALDPGQSCEPWYAEGAAPPGYDFIGVCAVPL